MDLSPYLETVRQGVTGAAALGDDSTRLVAERLGGAVEASTRLALISALSDAAAQISAEIAPSSVELRLNGVDPDLVVAVAAPTAEPTLLLPAREEPGPEQAEVEDVPAAPARGGPGPGAGGGRGRPPRCRGRAGSPDQSATARLSQGSRRRTG